jgi:hypothetical protein
LKRRRRIVVVLSELRHHCKRVALVPHLDVELGAASRIFDLRHSAPWIRLGAAF